MKNIYKLLIVSILFISSTACSKDEKSEIYKKYPDASVIKLNKDSATINGNEIEEYDYTWNIDPTTVHDDFKNAPAEYYTGSKPETDAEVYIDHELYYYPLIDKSLFTLVNYDGEKEFVAYYQDGENDEYIFATLPNLNGGEVPTSMMHTAKEAAENKVLHIVKAGTYILEGSWTGQIYIDLGDEDESFVDESAKVTLILNGVDITCSVAPGIIFDDLYECDNTWSESDSHPNTADTENAGANIIIADDTENTVTGQNIFRMLKTKYKDEESTGTIKVQKKQRKIDAALYSYVSMNIEADEKGTGSLSVTSNFEGIDSELHLTFLGGNITINSQDDGINVNEDNVSVVTFKGGEITINASLGQEGDGVDSNGFVVIDGANLYINNVTAPDNAVDSEDGIYFLSGTVTIDGELYQSEQTNLREISSASQGFNNHGFGNKGEMKDFNREDPPEGFDPQNMPEDFRKNGPRKDFNPENLPKDFEKRLDHNLDFNNDPNNVIPK